MEIHLSDHVVILDEAHNIEEASRSAASCTISQSDITDTRDELIRMKEKQYSVEECETWVSLSF